MSFSLSSDSGAESNTLVSVEVVLSHAYSATTTVDHVLFEAGTSATITQDFSYVTGVLTFEPGETSRTFGLVVVDDTEDDRDETVAFAFGTIVNGSPGSQNTFTYTIEEDSTDWYKLPFSETFEERTAGDLNGQHGWIAEGVAVQTNVTFGGSVKAGAMTHAPASLQHSFDGARPRVWVDMRLQVIYMQETPVPPADCTVAIYVATNSQVMVFDGTNAVASGLTAVAGEWVRFTTLSEYATRTWSLYVDDAYAGPFDFFDSTATGFREMTVKGTLGAVDDMLVTESDLYSLYASGGSITPLAWVQGYGGDPALTNQDGDALDLNQEYLIETDPTQSNAFEIIAFGFTPSNTPYLHYNANGLPNGTLVVSNRAALLTGPGGDLAGSLSMPASNVVEWVGSESVDSNAFLRLHVFE